MKVADPYDLARFRTAQQPVFETALAELRAGRKQTHWMWFIFPQLRGLGRSPTAQFYGISSSEEARAYLADPVLGERLRLATAATLTVEGRSAHAIFGSPDDLKFRSCMTLFARLDSQGPFRDALEAFYAGVEDEATVRLLEDG
jgi:uncharacterized protein (DUF1810 family)